MKKIFFTPAILLVVFTMSYCGNTKRTAEPANALFRDKWMLKELEGQVIPDSTRSSFEFSEGNISGNTGCNQLSAGFTPGRNQSITFRPQAVTRMACPDEKVAALETKFLDALSRS